MLGSFIDTIMICTMTGLVIVVTGAWQLGNDSLTGAALTAHAFSGPLGQYGAMIVGFGLALFAYSTIIAWSYYGDRSAYYLFGERAVLPYRILFTLLVAVGAAVPLNLVWNIADITNTAPSASPEISSTRLPAAIRSRTAVSAPSRRLSVKLNSTRLSGPCSQVAVSPPASAPSQAARPRRTRHPSSRPSVP